MQPRQFKTARPRPGLFSLLLLALGIVNPPLFAAPPTIVTLPAQSSGARIQQALDNLPPNGDVVLSPGRYEISQPLLLWRGNQTLRGSGSGTILHLANGADCPVVILGPPVDNPKLPVSHVRLANIIIDGNRKNQRTEHWRNVNGGPAINNNGVHIWNATDVVVEHVICCRCRSGGLVAADVRRLRVSNFHSYDNQFDGLACYQTDESRFEALSLHDNLAAGISLDLNFNHNCVTNAVLTANDLGIFMRDSRDNVFKGLTIARSRHDGVFMAQSVEPTAKGWRLVSNTQCTGNHFDNLLIRDSGGKAFQVNDASCTNNVITGACFLRNAQGGLSQPASHPVSLAEVAKR